VTDLRDGCLGQFRFQLGDEVFGLKSLKVVSRCSHFKDHGTNAEASREVAIARDERRNRGVAAIRRRSLIAPLR
jgi:hypothetical protein